ncbi:MAG: serine hydrolase [Ruminococcus callidus]|nr:serine hydrolase [Ruminococcus callidus]
MEERKSKRGKIGLMVFLLVDLLLIGAAVYMIAARQRDIPTGAPLGGTAASVLDSVPEETVPAATEPDVPAPLELADEIECGYAYVVNASDGLVLAEKNGEERMYPASMTKLMTLLLACESGIEPDEPFTFDQDMLDPLIERGASRVGFEAGETVTFGDLLYGSVLPSGGDATAALAIMIDGDEQTFANHMNRKAQALGMFDTHFSNASGLHAEDHYSTARDIALLLQETLKHDLCRTVLTTPVYTTSRTSQHPNGLELYSVVDQRMAGFLPQHIVFQGGKTGFTDYAGYCLASFAEQEGTTYIVVVAGGEEKETPCRDAQTLYELLCGVPEQNVGEQ